MFEEFEEVPWAFRGYILYWNQKGVLISMNCR